MTATLFAAEPIHPHVLKFKPPTAQARDLDLQEAFERFKRPELRGRSADTLGEYRTHLRRWRECFDDLRARCAAAGERWKYRMSYPVLPEIGKEELRIFRVWLESQTDGPGPRFSTRTINKHLGSVQAILKAAEDADQILRAPAIKPLPAHRAARKLWLTHEQVDSWMDSCEIADWPRDLPRPTSTYWRTLGVLWCIYGFRTQEVVSYESSKEPLDWSQIRWERTTPHPDGHAVCPWGWLTYTPVKQRRFKEEPLVLPLNEIAYRWLREIWDGQTQGPVIPFPLNNGMFYNTWHAIVRRAGITPKAALDGSVESYKPKHLRKTATTWLNNHRPGMADYIVGHASERSPTALIAAAGPRSQVAKDFYDCAENRILDALLTLPLPESFSRLKPDRQQRLF